MDAGESKLENKIVKDEVLVVDDEEVGDEEMMHHLRREIGVEGGKQKPEGGGGN